MPIYVPPVVQTHKMEFESAVLPPYPYSMKLNAGQLTACAGLTVPFAMLLGRPIANMQVLYFISETPDKLSQKAKSELFFRTVGTTKWMKGNQPFALEYASWAGFLVMHDAIAQQQQIRDLGMLSGFASGAITGLGVSLVRHPYDVLRATAEHPSSPMHLKTPKDVLVEAVKHRRENLKDLYKGIGVGAMANVVQFGIMMGLWEMTKGNGVEASPQRTFLYAYLAVIAGHAAQYPIHFTKQALVEFNRAKRFGGVTAKRFMIEQRKKQGMSIVWTGFFSSRPLIGCVTGALVLTAFDTSKRWVWKQQGGK